VKTPDPEPSASNVPLVIVNVPNSLVLLLFDNVEDVLFTVRLPTVIALPEIAWDDPPVNVTVEVDGNVRLPLLVRFPVIDQALLLIVAAPVPEMVRLLSVNEPAPEKVEVPDTMSVPEVPEVVVPVVLNPPELNVVTLSPRFKVPAETVIPPATLNALLKVKTDAAVFESPPPKVNVPALPEMDWVVVPLKKTDTTGCQVPSHIKFPDIFLEVAAVEFSVTSDRIIRLVTVKTAAPFNILVPEPSRIKLLYVRVGTTCAPS
jgi:hypothetical protein